MITSQSYFDLYKHVQSDSSYEYGIFQWKYLVLAWAIISIAIGFLAIPNFLQSLYPTSKTSTAPNKNPSSSLEFYERWLKNGWEGSAPHYNYYE